MRPRFVISLSTLGLAFSAVAASSAEAQSRAQVTICRDGTQVRTADARACDAHRGIDDRATERVRQYDQRSASNDRRDDRRDQRDERRDERRDPRDDRGYDQRNNGQSNDPRYDNRNDDDRNSNDPRYDNRNSNDPRYDNRNNDPRYNGGMNGGRYGNGRNAVYEWQGRVDDEVQFQIRADRAVERLVGRNEVRDGRGRILNPLPRQEGTLVVERLDGRGPVDVIEQPSARNGYTATVRVRDPEGGAASYRFVAYWQSNGQGYDSRYGRRQ